MTKQIKSSKSNGNDIKGCVAVCVEIGRLMLVNGAETYRVEDTVYRVGHSLGVKNISTFVVPTAIIVTAEDEDQEEITQLTRVTERHTNLEMIANLNQLSRNLSKEPRTPNEVRVMLYHIQMDTNEYKPFVSILLSAIATTAFTLIFEGSIADMFPAFILGGVATFIYDHVSSITNISFFAELVSAFTVGLLTLLFIQFGIGENTDIIIISSVMVLVPGIAITNGLRDLMAGHLLAGVAVLSKAIMTAAAIGIGIVLVLSFM